MIAIGCDHGAFALKQEILRYFEKNEITFKDFGTYSEESCDYPDFAAKTARAVSDKSCDCGIVLCTTGIGVSIVANKVRGVRCALCSDTVSAELTRLHNDSNMLAIGAGIVGRELALRIVDVWLNTGFEGGRHERRVNKISEVEKEMFKDVE